MADQEQGNLIVPASPPVQSCTVEFVPGHLRMHTISEDKLETLLSGKGSLYLTFFGICFGAGISFGIVLFNGVGDPVHKMAYEVFVFVSFLLSAFFGICGGLDLRRVRTRIEEIKSSKSPN